MTARFNFLLKFLPWFLAGISGLALVASASEISRLKVKFDEASRFAYADHRDIRRQIIRLMLSEAASPIVVYGDSITEMARLPESICAQQVVNAGIGAASIAELTRSADRIFDGHNPSVIVAAVGANDIGSDRVGSDASQLTESLLRHSQRVLIVPSTSDSLVRNRLKAAADSAGVAFIDLPVGSFLDGTHLSRQGYSRWLPALSFAISSRCAD